MNIVNTEKDVIEVRCSDCLAPMDEKETEEGKTIFKCKQCNYTFEPAPGNDRCPECSGPLFWNRSYKRLGRAEKSSETESNMGPISIRYFCRDCGERFVAIYEPRKFIKRASLAKMWKEKTEKEQ